MSNNDGAAVAQCMAVGEELSRLMVQADFLREENERLRQALLDAADEVQDWGAYADDYFKEKHDLEGCIAAIKAAALGEGK